MRTEKNAGVAKTVRIALVVVGVLLSLLLASCSQPQPKSSSEVNREEQQTLTDIIAAILANQPAPGLDWSQERAQVARRAELFANPEKLGWMYLVDGGKVLAVYPIKGKVSSLNSYLTAQEMSYSFRPCSGCSIVTFMVPAPDIDGTYGRNVDGVFAFTPENAYVEWNGKYMYCDQPLNLATTPDIVYVAPLE